MLDVLKIIFWTLVPTFELRFSIPIGIAILKMNWIFVFFIAVITNIILGIIIFVFIEFIIKIITKIPFVKNLWEKYVAKTQTKIHQGVEKYGEWAIAIFIGIPLPGSGVYTGALAAFLIGLDGKKFFIANIIGVLIAGILMTIFTLTFENLSGIFFKTM